MKKIIMWSMIAVLLFGVNMAIAKDKPNGTPFAVLWEAIQYLQDQIDDIQLISGPPGEQGPPGPQGPPGEPGWDEDRIADLEDRMTALEGPACTPTDEICDEEDNDCDGLVDEGDVCEPIDCDDDNLCTDDSYNTQSHSCDYVGNTDPCDDGVACTVNDMCDGTGNCAGGATIVCDDDNPCTTDFCNPTSGCEVEVNTSNACSDGDECTINDQCTPDGSCAGTLHPDVGTACDGPDSDYCTNGTYTCGSVGGLECVDDIPNFVEICDGQDNDCDGAEDEGCDDCVDDNECTDDIYNTQTYECEYPPVASGTPCTNGTCDGVGVCITE